MIFKNGQRVCSGAGTPHTVWGTVLSQEGDLVTVLWDNGRTSTVLALTLVAQRG